MTMAASIIAIIISVLSLGLCAGVLVRERKASKELDAILKDIKSLEPYEPEYHVDSSLGEDIIRYDKGRNILVLKSNLKVEGFVSAGEKEE